MPPTSLLDIVPAYALALLPSEGGYFSIVKIIVYLLCVVLWAHSTAWVQLSKNKIRSMQTPWQLTVFGAGAACLIVWLLIPWFLVGLLVFLAGFGGALAAFGVAHNSRVSPARSVFTKAHWNRFRKGGDPKAAAAAEVVSSKERTRIRDARGKTPQWPTEAAERAGYQALQDLLFDAIWRRATDVLLDFVPQQDIKIIYRVDGVDRAREPIEGERGSSLLKHFKRIAGMNVDEHRKPQSGKFSAAIGAGAAEKKVDVTAKTSGSTAGQRMFLKLISDESKFQLADIGLTEDQLAVFERVSAASRGVVICSGPKSSGTPSTLYAILRTHDAFMKHIQTLETSKAMDLENITQHVYRGQAEGPTFGRRLRSILRSGPDICMASETPDAESVASAAEAARQGKKIYLGMRASDSFSALRKYLEGVGDPALAAAGLVAISNQRLVRILCSDCRRAYKPDPKLLKKGNLPMDADRPFFRPPNPAEIEVDKYGNQSLCPVCQGSGYLGRTGVFEILDIDDELRALIAKGTPLPTIKVEARKKGMQSLQTVALRKVYDGLTSINEVLRVTKEGAPPQRRA
jgi:type II secretory ATPase GspE/PulE/Tfp pilus assembly ATPase PilB-like protein